MLEKKILGIIPARGGSKGVPKKNIRNVAGKPLLSWTVEAALEANIFDRLIISTDSEEIAEVGRKYGAEVPFLRPPEYASDSSSAMSVVEHSMASLLKVGEKYDLIFYLQPTSPLRTADDLNDALNLLREKQADSVVTVCEAEHPPHFINTLPENLSLAGFIQKDFEGKNRQEFQKYFTIHGAIRLARWEHLERTRSWYAGKAVALITSQERSLDIDTEYDLKIADLLLRNL